MRVWNISFENIEKAFEHKFNSILTDFSFGKDGFDNDLIMITNTVGSVYLYSLKLNGERS